MTHSRLLTRLTVPMAGLAALTSAVALSASPALADTAPVFYGCTGSVQTSPVPAGYNEAIVTLWGADGGNATNNLVTTPGGNGERLMADVPVTAGSSLDVIVGCQGGANGAPNNGAGGYGGGGGGGMGDSGGLRGAGGGGASYILPHGGAFSTLYAIAGGGGGAGPLGGDLSSSDNGAGGAGGNAEQNGSDGGADTDASASGLGGSGGASGNTGGSGGATGCSCSNGLGLDGSAGQGGNGGSYDSNEGGAGGGGGGGLVGGGGGGYGYSSSSFGGGGGGGGGGRGGVQNGATLVSAIDSANAGDGAVSITYTVAADIAVSPSSHDFGTVTNPGSVTEPFRVTNTGEQPLNIGQATLTGANADQFTIVSGQDTCSGQTVTGGGTCTVEVAFAPTGGGAESASLSIPSNATSGTATVALSGTGQAATPPAATPQPTPPTPSPTPTAPKLVEHLSAIGAPTAKQLFTRGEQVRVYCNQACSLNVQLMVYDRAVTRGQHYRKLLHAAMARQPWTRVTVAHTVVTMSKAGYRTVYVKLTPAVEKALSYAGSILLGVYAEPASSHGAVTKHWVNVPGPDMNAQVAAHQHGR